MAELLDDNLDTIEIEMFLEAVYRHYGFDLRNYARASLKRRVWAAANGENVATISALQDKVLHDPRCMERFLCKLTVNVTSMFRDPPFYRAFREKVVPLLRTYPFVRIWHAGCSSGQEAYSMAILLTEEGLYDKCRIYATDMDETALARAKGGIFPLDAMREYTDNYIQAGGSKAFSQYYSARYDGAIITEALKKNIIFAQHNLATDESFNEFNVILCRNVMIYFNKTLQDRVHDILFKSLPVFGILSLGRKESIRFTPHAEDYAPLDEREKIYRRVR